MVDYKEAINMMAAEIVVSECEIEEARENIDSIRRGGLEVHNREHYESVIRINRERVLMFKSAINKLRS